MFDAHSRDTAIWIHRVLSTIARSIGGTGDDGYAAGDVMRLAQALECAPRWEACPTAADTMGGSSPHRYQRISLREPLYAEDYSVLLIAWPAGHVTPIHDHDGLWGMELVLDGVLQVEAFTMTVSPSLQLVPGAVTPLGMGDHTTFSEQDYAHRCRNLSARRPALSLHVYGGTLQRYRAYDQDTAGCWGSTAKRAELELVNR